MLTCACPEFTELYREAFAFRRKKAELEFMYLRLLSTKTAALSFFQSQYQNRNTAVP